MYREKADKRKGRQA